MYPILEYSSKYLILEYYVYFHTYTLYIYRVFVQPMYMYILTVSVCTIHIHADSFMTLLIENRTTHSISVGLDSQCCSQNQCHHHLHRQHLARFVSVRFTDACLRVFSSSQSGGGCQVITLDLIFFLLSVMSLSCTYVNTESKGSVW